MRFFGLGLAVGSDSLLLSVDWLALVKGQTVVTQMNGGHAIRI